MRLVSNDSGQDSAQVKNPASSNTGPNSAVADREPPLEAYEAKYDLGRCTSRELLRQLLTFDSQKGAIQKSVQSEMGRIAWSAESTERQAKVSPPSGGAGTGVDGVSYWMGFDLGGPNVSQGAASYQQEARNANSIIRAQAVNIALSTLTFGREARKDAVAAAKQGDCAYASQTLTEANQLLGSAKQMLDRGLAPDVSKVDNAKKSG